MLQFQYRRRVNYPLDSEAGWEFRGLDVLGGTGGEPAASLLKSLRFLGRPAQLTGFQSLVTALSHANRGLSVVNRTSLSSEALLVIGLGDVCRRRRYRG
jgi:hypothetical protein